MIHYSVMLHEAIENLNLKENSIIIDATLGYGGHSSEILKHIKKGHLYAFDQDKEAIEFSYNKLKKINNNFTIIKSNFINMVEELEKIGVKKVDGILFDLGVSSPQIDNINRGFTFMNDADLDMRMDLDNDLTALKVINEYKEEELLKIFYTYGEEPKSKIIASQIVKERQLKKITRTKELVDIIAKATKAKYFNTKHPERRIFQAIRIEVNKELTVLEKILPKCIDLLNIGGRISVITFHSLEDRIVKKTFKYFSEVDDLVKGLPTIPEQYKPKLKIVNKKPITASSEEINENSRSKSAKLRVVERI